MDSGGLNGVSCTSAKACTAVGYTGEQGGTNYALVERWNGKRWLIQPSPKPHGSKDASLLAVSCTSRNVCTAVGSFDNRAGTTLPLAERWNGARWSIERTPNPPGSTTSSLNGVSCVSKTACIAAGNADNGVVAELWNGTRWAIEPAPNPGGDSNAGFLGVSCTSMTACTAVGGTAVTAAPLAERWDGVTWTVQSTPGAGLDGSQLLAVSCASRIACAAVGAVGGEGAAGSTLDAFWNGMTWSYQEDQLTCCNPSLSGVSCTTGRFCIAVGDVIERWNGNHWSVENESLGGFDAVSCTSRTSCMAVGASDAPVAARRS